MKVVTSSQFDNGYEFDAEEVLEATNPEYREFLKEAGYVDLKKTPNLFVASKVLRIDYRVIEAGRGMLYGGDGDILYKDMGCVVYINHKKILRLINNLGGRVLTTALMYKLFIPYLKQSAENGNEEAKASLDEMTEIKAEWLEDRILGKTRFKIRNAERRITLLDKGGYFDISDLNEYGYPTSVKGQGEFYYRFRERTNIVAVREGYDGELGLSWWSPGPIPYLGVRFAKFFK